jgi:hypothetical protein
MTRSCGCRPATAPSTTWAARKADISSTPYPHSRGRRVLGRNHGSTHPLLTAATPPTAPSTDIRALGASTYQSICPTPTCFSPSYRTPQS